MDNIRNDLFNFRSQTCSLQVDRIASFHRLEQVSANLRKRKRSGLTYSPLGKQRQKELRWQKHSEIQLKAQSLAMSHVQKATGETVTAVQQPLTPQALYHF